MLLFLYGKIVFMSYEKKKVYAIDLIGGKGLRFASLTPKQFVLVNGKPLFAYALSTLDKSPLIDEIVVVGNIDFLERTKKSVSALGLIKPYHVVPGGEKRMDSVFSALSFLKESNIDPSSIVLIQDGDRPNLSERLIEENVKAAFKTGAAVTAIPSTDSLLVNENGLASSYLVRESIYRAQTPQTFGFEIIYSAFLKVKEENKSFTDDASIVLNNGGKVSIVMGDCTNIKINTEQDLDYLLAEK